MKFYKIGSADKASEAQIKSLIPYDPQSLKRGEWCFPTLPAIFRIAEGKVLYDLVRIQDIFNFAVTGQVVAALEEGQITGWKTYPIIVDGPGIDLHGFQVTGKGGSLITTPGMGFVTGLRFDVSRWDGSDIFILKDTMLTLCTSRARDVLLGCGAVNIKLDDIQHVVHFQ